jgi:hypothetical protein
MQSSYPLPEDLSQLTRARDLSSAVALIDALVARLQQAEIERDEAHAQAKEAVARAREAEQQALCRR